MTATQQVTALNVRSDRHLSRYNPLARILFFDDFDDGVNGWCELIGNHNGNLDNVRDVMADLRPPQLSSCTFFDIGTHGSMSGTYALKVATRPRAFHMAQAIKRVTSVQRGLVQFETYFTYKSEQTHVHRGVPAAWDGNLDPSELDFGEFTVSNDVCEREGVRYHCALRYTNTDEHGQFVQKWMYKTSVQTTTKMERTGLAGPAFDYHVQHPDDWAEVPGGYQPLCYNEVPTKINWHYLRWIFDTETRRNVELQVNGLIMDLRNIPVPKYEHGYKSINQLMNFCVDVRTHKAVRNFLYLDSVLVSVDW